MNSICAVARCRGLANAFVEAKGTVVPGEVTVDQPGSSRSSRSKGPPLDSNDEEDFATAQPRASAPAPAPAPVPAQRRATGGAAKTKKGKKVKRGAEREEEDHEGGEDDELEEEGSAGQAPRPPTRRGGAKMRVASP